MVKKLYINLIFIITIFFANFSFSEQVENDKSQNSLNLPPSFKEVISPAISFNNSLFYNQAMEKKSLENFDNRFIIIHFWATWCMDCQNELVVLNKLQKEFRKKALLVLAISEDFKEIAAIDEYFTKNKIDFLDIYVDKRNSIYKSLGINHLPASYLVDFNGDVIATSLPGVPVDWDDESLKKFLEDKVSKHQLLPPEFKNMRDSYNSPLKQKESKSLDQQKKVEILIN